MKRLFVVLLIVLCCGTVVFADTGGDSDPLADAGFDESPLPPLDVFFLIDVSGSMRFTDPNQAALHATADFIDRLTLGVSRVGIIGFSGRLQYIVPFQPVNDEEDKLRLRETVTSFIYNGFTDIGAALLQAAGMLYTAGELNNPMVILISDGYIEISPMEAERRTVEMSFADVEQALNILERNVPIYTIGMFNSGGVDVALLEMISERSDGYARFTYDADELPDMFMFILLNHLEKPAEYVNLYELYEIEEDDTVVEDFEDDEDDEDDEIPEVETEDFDEADEIPEDYEVVETSEDYEADEVDEIHEFESAENMLVNGFLYAIALLGIITAGVGVVRFANFKV